MAEPVFGLTRGAARLVGEMADRHRQRLPDVGRRTRRVAAAAGSAAVKLGKTDASHAKGASGTISIWSGDAGSETDTGDDETAWNKFANVTSGKWVLITEVNGQWYLTSAEC